MATSKKDYITIAAIVRLYATSAAPISARKSERESVAKAAGYAVEIAKDLAHHFAADNPAFDRARFLKACGIGEGKQS